MENYSRVTKYHELRKKIENMDLYSYYEHDEENSNFDTTSSSTYQLNKTGKAKKDVPLFNYDHIKKNTLSISLNELIDKKTNNENSEAQKIHELVKTKARKVTQKKEKKTVILYLVIGVLALILIVLLVVFSIVIWGA